VKKTDPAKEAGNGRYLRKEDMINHPNPTIQSTPGLVTFLMDCVFERQGELPASGFCCVKVRREANGEINMLDVQPKVDAVEEKHALDPFEALAADMADHFLGLELENRGSGIDFGEEGETTEDEE